MKHLIGLVDDHGAKTAHGQVVGTGNEVAGDEDVTAQRLLVNMSAKARCEVIMKTSKMTTPIYNSISMGYSSSKRWAKSVSRQCELGPLLFEAFERRSLVCRFSGRRIRWQPRGVPNASQLPASFILFSSCRCHKSIWLAQATYSIPARS